VAPFDSTSRFAATLRAKEAKKLRSTEKINNHAIRVAFMFFQFAVALLAENYMLNIKKNKLGYGKYRHCLCRTTSCQFRVCYPCVEGSLVYSLRVKLARLEIVLNLIVKVLG
jgi:hypothetical protein